MTCQPHEGGGHPCAAGLQILSASEGNILEDESAISVITEAKTLGNEITNKQKVAEQTEQEIEQARTAYKPCGDYTAILFFCISGGSACLLCKAPALPSLPLRHAACNNQPLRACSLRFFTFLLLHCCSCAK